MQPAPLTGSAASQRFLSAGPALMDCHLTWVLTKLVVLSECFFNSLVVGALCSLIFWHFCLFLDFILVVILLVVWESKGFLSTPSSWPEFCLVLLKTQVAWELRRANSDCRSLWGITGTAQDNVLLLPAQQSYSHPGTQATSATPRFSFVFS